MTNFIFMVMYNHQIERGNGKNLSRYMGALILSFCISLDFLFLISILKKLIWIKVVLPLLENRFFLITVLASMGIITYMHFNQQRIDILNENPRYSSTTLSKLIVFFAVTIPMAGVLYLASRS